MKLALDNQISKSAAHRLREMGFLVVYHAKNEPDEVWIENAIYNGADILISPDLDIPNYLDKMDLSTIWIDIPQNLPSVGQAQYIAKQINKLIKRQVISSPDFKLINIEKFTYIVKKDKVDLFFSLASHIDRMKISYGALKGYSLLPGGDV